MHAGHHKQTHEVIRGGAMIGAHVAIVFDRTQWRDRMVGPTVIHQQFSAARLERGEIGLGGILIGGVAFEHRHLLLQIKIAHRIKLRPKHKVAHEAILKPPGRRRACIALAITSDEGLPVVLVTGHITWIEAPTRRIARSRPELLHRLDLALGQTIGGVTTLTDERTQINLALMRTVDDTVGKSVTRVTGGECRFLDQFQLRRRNRCRRQSTCIQGIRQHQLGAVDHRIADHHAIEILGVPLHLGKPHLAAVRAADEIGALLRLPVIGF